MAEYKVHILDVGDADAIVVKYRKNSQAPWVVAVIDAGNVGDGVRIKSVLPSSDDGKYHIDYAFCTHPDKDHKGGFFDLLEDKSVIIKQLYLMDPYDYINMDDIDDNISTWELKKITRSPFNHPNDAGKNLIDIAERKGILAIVREGKNFQDIPLKIVGPSKEYYKEVVLEMVSKFAELSDDSDTEKFDEEAKVDEDEAKSVIDEDDDTSATNASSLVILFTPNDNKFLFTGDANCASLQNIIDKYKSEIAKCILKVPHHGSKHNLNTKLIDELKPTSAVISAKGSKKHPNSGIVYWLSKHCNVYSTHKSSDLVYKSEPVIENYAIPLKHKMED